MISFLHDFIKIFTGYNKVQVHSLFMPLESPIDSNLTKAPFLGGENILIMNGSIVTPDSLIGANTYIGFNCHLTKASIGRYVSIADSVLIGPGEHPLDSFTTSAFIYDDPYQTFTTETVSIQDDVWIGAGSIIRRGVNIGFGAIVGANSFVNTDVPPFGIVAGSPAKLLRYRFNAKIQDFLLNSKWTTMSKESAKAFLASIKEFEI